MITSSNNTNNKTQLVYIYPKEPKRNPQLRQNDEIVELTTNLLKLKLSENEQKLCLYYIEIIPELAKDNFPLYSKIQRRIDSELNKYFTRKFFSGLNLFASSDNPPKEIKINTNVDNIDYSVIFKLTKKLEFDKINDLNDFEGYNQRIKSFIERITKDIMLKNTKTIKFGYSRTIVKINTKNVKVIGQESVYSGFKTSVQRNENGFFLLVLHVNTHIREITVYEKIKELRSLNANLGESEIRKIIESYFKIHKTVLATYGSYREYCIDTIDFDASPRKTSFNIKDGDKMKTITVEEYFKKQYNKPIRDPEQPLIRAETKLKKKQIQKKDNSGNIDVSKYDHEDEEERIIYLVPELLNITGNPDETESKNRRALVSKTKIDPNIKLKEINAIHDLMTCNTGKKYINRQGKEIECKTPLQVSKEWGISLGDNLRIKGRVFPQPNLFYKNNEKITPKNGKFMSGHAYNSATFTKDNFIYIYDMRDKSDIKTCLRLLIDKAKYKGININFHPQDMHGVGLSNFHSWNDIYKNLNIVKKNANTIGMAIVFLSSNLEKYYSNLKSFFTNEAKCASQFIISKKLQDQKRAGSIMFNIVEQINVKMGGTNFFIDFYKQGIIPKNKIYMIIGLETRQSSNGIDLVMTSSISQNLNKIITSVITVQNIQEEKENAIGKLIELSFSELKKTGCPRPPDYIILYRQGGNNFQNKKLSKSEVPIFTKVLKNKFEKFKIKFIYVCCNLKSDLKFFQNNNSNYQNPKSGLCVDSEVTQKGKYEFYIQPQFVNQGCATPCHYEVMYEDRDEPIEVIENNQKKIIDNNIKLEELEKLTFYLTFYYWTWAGAIRVPGSLKLASTCMDFYTKHLGGKLEKENKTFINPEYI